MVRLKNQPKLRTNLDTDFLKLIAVLSMTVDLSLIPIWASSAGRSLPPR